MWFFNPNTGNFSVGEAPEKEVTLEDGAVVKKQDTEWVQIQDRPEPYDDFIFDGEEWIAKPPIVKSLWELKQDRHKEVESIIVTTQSGRSFDGNEEAQNRMARAIAALNPTEESLWVLANNIPTMVSREELQEALRLASAAQTAIWVAPYQ